MPACDLAPVCSHSLPEPFCYLPFQKFPSNTRMLHTLSPSGSHLPLSVLFNTSYWSFLPSLLQSERTGARHEDMSPKENIFLAFYAQNCFPRG